MKAFPYQQNRSVFAQFHAVAWTVTALKHSVKPSVEIKSFLHQMERHAELFLWLCYDLFEVCYQTQRTRLFTKFISVYKIIFTFEVMQIYSQMYITGENTTVTSKNYSSPI
jgi:hypothetical protein